MRARRQLLLLPLLALLAISVGCRTSRCADVRALPTAGAEQDVLVVGDSVLAWNDDRCQSVADHLALARGLSVRSVAKSGTRLLSGEPRIPEQVPEGAVRVVVLDGGGNDLNTSCECGACDDVLDALVSEDGKRGAMPDLIDELTSRGAHVVLLRYYETREGAWYGFDRCHDVVALLGDRYTTLAAARDDVTLVDAREIIGPGEPGLYEFDNVHPSDAGAEKLGRHLADVVASLPQAP